MFSILRLQKIKTRSQLAASQNHNLRLKPVVNADPEKTHLNKMTGAKNYKELICELEDRFLKNDIKPRKDSVQTVEVLLTASPEFFEDKTEEDLRKWANKNYQWAKKEFGENLLQFVLHLDEITPHIHLIFTPITHDGRLSMKDLYGGKDKLSALQTRYSKSMEEFGLKRGNSGSKAKHTTIKEFYTFVNKLKNLTTEQITELSKKLEEFNNKKDNKETTKDYENLIKNIINLQTQTYTKKTKKMRRKI